MEDFNVGDKVYFTKTFREIYWQIYSKSPPPKLKTPIEKKIYQIVHAKDGVLYQVKDGHFHESWIGEIVFKNKEEAEASMRERK